MPHHHLRGLLLLALIALGAAAGADEPATRMTAPEDLAARFQRAYSILIDGNRQDAARNQQRATRTQAAATTAKQRGNHEQARRLTEAADLYRQLSKQNTRIVELFAERQTGQPMREAMREILTIEAKLKALTEQKPDRAWLTFQEVERFRNMGYTSTVSQPDVLPFASNQWRRSR